MHSYYNKLDSAMVQKPVMVRKTAIFLCFSDLKNYLISQVISDGFSVFWEASRISIPTIFPSTS